jgi:magnesium chelatase family protein
MSSKIISAAVVGLEAELVEVEADTSSGPLGAFTIVGLPDTAVSESRERVRSAIKNSGFNFPKIKVTVNLAPADLKKYGPSYDLPIAVSILNKTGKVVIVGNSAEMLFVGELALSGEVRTVNGVLPIAIKARAENIKTIFVPRGNSQEAKLVKELEVIPVDNLEKLARHLSGQELIEPTLYKEFDFSNNKIFSDMAYVRGQEHAKRAIEIAAAGAHNIFILWTKTTCIYV